MSETVIVTIDGTDGNDLLVGTTNNDVIFAGLGEDTITASGGDDVLSGGPNYGELNPPEAGTLAIGDHGEVILAPDQSIEILNGGPGTDTVFLAGEQSSFTLLIGPNETLLVDRRPVGEGVDLLENIERLDFAIELDAFGGSPMNLDLFGRAPGVGEDDLESIIELYIAYFNRAPDAIGLAFWANAYADGTSLDEMAALFMQQEETADTFTDDMTSGDIVDLVYQNVLGREADDDGRAFWIEVLDSGAVPQDQFIREVILGAQADPYDGATGGFLEQQALDRLYLSTKTDIGAYFAVHRGMSDVANATATMELYVGTQQSMWDAVDAVDAFYASALDPATGEFLMPIVGVLDNPFDVG